MEKTFVFDFEIKVKTSPRKKSFIAEAERFELLKGNEKSESANRSQ